jgi:hypothetical protein
MNDPGSIPRPRYRRLGWRISKGENAAAVEPPGNARAREHLHTWARIPSAAAVALGDTGYGARVRLRSRGDRYGLVSIVLKSRHCATLPQRVCLLVLDQRAHRWPIRRAQHWDLRRHCCLDVEHRRCRPWHIGGKQSGRGSVVRRWPEAHQDPVQAPRLIALTALVLQGPNVVCAAGGSGFGEVLVATDPGRATLLVHTTGKSARGFLETIY